jgi:hypothetical protein
MRRLAVPALVLLVATSAAAQAPAGPPAPPAPEALRLTPKSFARLRWIEGTWRGAGTHGTTQAPFFERYRFADDSTLLVDAFPDSTLAKVSETTRFELRGGRLGNTGEGARWVAVRLDGEHVLFAPVARARNEFTWRREAKNRWLATITVRRPDGTVQERFYEMTRLAPPR